MKIKKEEEIKEKEINEEETKEFKNLQEKVQLK